MNKNKIKINSDFINEIAKEELIDDISLRFDLSDSYETIKIDLTDLNNATLQRRKDLKIFKDFLINQNKSIKTQHTLYQVFRMFINDVPEFNSQVNLNSTLEKYTLRLRERVDGKTITANSYKSYRWRFKTIFCQCYKLNTVDFEKLYPEYNKRTNKISNPTVLDVNGLTKSFSKEQFKDITKILLNISLFIDDLIKNKREEKLVCFVYKDIYKLQFNLKYQAYRQLLNKKTICLALSFMTLTGLNLNPLLRMKKSDIRIDKEKGLVSFEVTCNRKRKVQKHNLAVNKNQIIFFERILENSTEFDANSDILFPYINNSLKDHKLSFYTATDFISNYSEIDKGFCGKYKGLKITARKIRNSYGNEFEDIDTRSVALFNTPKTAAKYYADGHSDDNNSQLQNAMNIYTLALSNSENIQDVKNKIEKINVINIEDINSLKEENSQITTSGIFCKNAKDGLEAEKYARKLQSLNLKTIESISCANILACFNCKNSILVNNFDNIYLLKSFYIYLNNIVYESDTSSLFSDKNAVKSALVSIKFVLDNKIDKKILNKVEKHINKNNIHPIWNLED